MNTPGRWYFGWFRLLRQVVCAVHYGREKDSFYFFNSCSAFLNQCAVRCATEDSVGISLFNPPPKKKQFSKGENWKRKIYFFLKENSNKILAKSNSNFKRTRSSLQAGCVASTNCKRRDQGMVQCVVAMVYRQGQPIRYAGSKLTTEISGFDSHDPCC